MAIEKFNDNPETFSIVVPVHNRESLITETLDSIYAQNYRPISLVVVDNNSTDNTLSVVDSWMKSHGSQDFHIVVVEESQPGATSARNRGMQEVTGDIMMFFDSDDLMLPDLASTVMNHFHDNPDLEILCWPIIIRDLDGNEHRSRIMGSRHMESHLIHCNLSTQSYAFHRNLVEKVGGWDSNLYAWNDFELGVRLLLSDPVCESVKRPLCIARRQKESITGETFHARAGTWEESLDKIEDTLRELTDKKSSDSYIRMVDYRRAILAAHYTREGHKDLGKALLSKSLANPTLGKIGRLAIRLSYFITSRHIRGAWTFFGPLIR